MDEILTEIVNCRSSPEHQNISHILVRLQNEINCQFLRQNTQSDNENFLSQFWSFIFEAGSDQNTSIRISAYRTTITLLLKITPYYPSLIQKTFFNSIRTVQIDSKSSQIVIAAFSFISNFTSIPFLNHILEISPILQNFTLIDSTFSDHIGPIIKNLSRIDNQWLDKLLFLYLEKGVKPQDRHLILAVTEIIKHEPSFFINELLKYVREHSTIRENLCLISYILSAIKFNFESFDFKDLVENLVEILSNPEKSTANDIDSALQILSLDKAPFTVSISENDYDETDDEQENDNSDKGKQKLSVQISSESYEYEFTMNVCDFIIRPSFYLLPLPINLLEISPNDGVLQMTSKFKTMAKTVNKSDARHKTKLYIFNQFSSVLSKSYHDMTSPCLQGFSLCLPTFLEMMDDSNILILTEHVIFSPQQSWFHMNDTLNVIKSIPYKYYSFYKDNTDNNETETDKKITNKFDTRRIIDLLVTFSMNSNEKLSKGSEKTIAKIVNFTDFAQGTSYLSEKTDFFDITSLHRFLSIFITILKKKRKIIKKEKTYKKYDKRETKHLQYFILRLIEVRSIYEDDIELFIQIINIMGFFDLHFVERQVLKELSMSAQSIIEATLLVVGCLKPDDDQISIEKVQSIYNYVAEEFSSLNFEIVPEMKMNYSNFLPSFSIALDFLCAIPRHCLLSNKKSSILDLFSYSMYFFQRKSALFAERYWLSHLDPRKNIDFLTTVQPTIEFIQDFRIIALYCRLFFSVAKKDESNEKLDLFCAALHNITRDEIDSDVFYPEFYALEIFSNKTIDKEKDGDDPMKTKVNQLDKEQQTNLFKFLIFYEKELKLVDKIGESTFDKVPEDSMQQIKEEAEKKHENNNTKKTESTTTTTNPEQQQQIISREVQINANVNQEQKQHPSYPLPKDPKLRRRSEKPKKKNQRQEPSETITSSTTYNSLENGELPTLQDKGAKKDSRINKRSNTRRSSSVEPLSKLAEKSKEESKKFARSDNENKISDEDESGFFLYSSESQSNSNDDYNNNNNETNTGKNKQNSTANNDTLGNNNINNSCLQNFENSSNDIEIPKMTQKITKINNAILSSNLVDQDPFSSIIKTQLKLSTFEFSKEQLQKLLRFYINKNDEDGIQKLLNYAETKGISLSLLNYMIPPNVIPTALNYLKVTSSDEELNELLKKCESIEMTNKIKYTIFSLNPSKNFDELINSPHITKKDIKNFTISVDLCSHQALVDLVVKLLKEAKSKKRLDYVLTMANVIFSFVTITKKEIDLIIQIVGEKDQIIPGLPLSQLVLTLSSKVESNEEFIKFVKNCYAKCLGKSSGILKLHQALIASPNSKASENLANISAPYVVSNIPSVFLAGIRFIHQALTSLSESDCIPLLKANLGKILKNFAKKRDMFPTAKVIGEPFTFILSRDSLRVSQLELISHAEEIIPSNKNASFEGLSLCLPRMIDAFNDQPNDILRILESKCDELLTEPGNMSNFKIYMMSLRERVEKALKNKLKEDIVSDFITQWMQECKKYDCYYMSEIIYEWENLIYQFYGLEQLLNYACYQFFKYIPRFFPLYIGLSRFIRKNYKAASDDDKEMIRQYLQNSAMIIPTRAHSLSTLLVTEIEYSKEALELASYPEDCDESEKLINSNPHFVELLNKIKSNV